MGKLFLVFIGMILILSGCLSKNAEELFPDNYCDTTNVKFSTTITQVISENCLHCHSGTLANGNPQVRLDSYDGVKTVIDNNRLWNAITGASKQMPPSGMLPDCPINKFKIWIDMGSPDN